MRSEVRHRLKEDRFAETAQDWVSWTREHGTNVLGGMVIGLLLIGLGVGGYFYMQNREQKASVQFGQATDTLNAPIRAASEASTEQADESYTSVRARAQAAQKKFQAIRDQYSYTRAGKISRYFIGICQIQAGDTSAGEATLKQIAGERDKDLAALSKLALASLYRSTNRNQQAIALYKGLADHPTHAVAKTTAQFELASLYESMGQPTESRKIYEDIQKQDPNGPIGQQALMKMIGIRSSGQMPPGIQMSPGPDY